MPLDNDLLNIVIKIVGVFAAIAIPILGWVIKRELNKIEVDKKEAAKKRDENRKHAANEREKLRIALKEATAERLIIRQTAEEAFTETVRRVEQFEREVERDYVRDKDLTRELTPILNLLQDLRDDRSVFRQQGDQIRTALDEIKALREDSMLFWKDYSGPLQWAKRESEK